MKPVPGRRTTACALVLAATVLGSATRPASAVADAVSPQPSNPSAAANADGWFRLSAEGYVFRYPGDGHTPDGNFAVRRGSPGSEAVVGTCFDTGSYVIPGAEYRARFFLQNYMVSAGRSVQPSSRSTPRFGCAQVS